MFSSFLALCFFPSPPLPHPPKKRNLRQNSDKVFPQEGFREPAISSGLQVETFLNGAWENAVSLLFWLLHLKASPSRLLQFKE